MRISDRHFAGVFQGVEAIEWCDCNGTRWSQMHRIEGRKLSEVFVYKGREPLPRRAGCSTPLLQASSVTIVGISVIS